MFLMFALQRPNVLPVGDLGVRSAIKRAYGLEELPKPKEVEQIAAKWHPYCSVAAWYLWRSLTVLPSFEMSPSSFPDPAQERLVNIQSHATRR